MTEKLPAIPGWAISWAKILAPAVATAVTLGGIGYAAAVARGASAAEERAWRQSVEQRISDQDRRICRIEASVEKILEGQNQMIGEFRTLQTHLHKP